MFSNILPIIPICLKTGGQCQTKEEAMFNNTLSYQSKHWKSCYRNWYYSIISVVPLHCQVRLLESRIQILKVEDLNQIQLMSNAAGGGIGAGGGNGTEYVTRLGPTF